VPLVILAILVPLVILVLQEQLQIQVRPVTLVILVILVIADPPDLQVLPDILVQLDLKVSEVIKEYRATQVKRVIQAIQVQKVLLVH
jgi:hypothetical protein